MKFFRMSRRVEADGTSLYQRSHELFELKTGRRMDAAFVGPLVVELDPEFIDGKLPTFYENPAVIATRQFEQDLRGLGISNIEVHPVVIRDEVHRRTIDDYVLLNIVGRVSCADMTRSDFRDLGEGMKIIDTLVLDAARLPRLDLFLIHEDTDCIVVSERVRDHLSKQAYGDILFTELAVA